MRRSGNALADRLTGDEIDERRARSNLERTIALAAAESTGGARAMGRSLRRVATRGPTNSLGQPWNGERWSCTACGARGDDRDDLPHGFCTKSTRPTSPHTLRFHPAAHHAAIVARRGLA